MRNRPCAASWITASSSDDQAIKAKQARKNQSKIETKEMKFRPKIDVGDYTTKKKHVLRFLSAGNKVKITIMFRAARWPIRNRA